MNKYPKLMGFGVAILLVTFLMTFLITSIRRGEQSLSKMNGFTT